jgi:hypothetical protein
MSVLQLYALGLIAAYALPQSVFGGGFLLIEVGEYFEAGEVDADFEGVEPW